MSSQGPKTGSAPVGVPAGYVLSPSGMRDSSDYTRYLKQAAIYSCDATTKAKDPWFVRGQDYRLQWLNGRHRCTACSSGAFIDGVDFDNTSRCVSCVPGQ
jgi:hypothetical protein